MRRIYNDSIDSGFSKRIPRVIEIGVTPTPAATRSRPNLSLQANGLIFGFRYFLYKYNQPYQMAVFIDNRELLYLVPLKNIRSLLQIGGL